jgi:ATPase subunit of ABC transporter with duplicated ATPase domains
MANQEAVRKQQERRAQQIKDFINTAGVHKKAAKQTQSRMKLLEKIRNDMTEVDTDDPYLKLSFPSSDTLPPPVVSVMDAYAHLPHLIMIF